MNTIFIDINAQNKSLSKSEIKMYNGAPTLFINGAPNAGLTYMTYNPIAKHYESFGKIGVDLASVAVTADYHVFQNQPVVWLAPDQYDYSFIDEKMKLILEANPNAYIFPRVYICSPPWWDEQHPDQLVKWDDGSIERKIGRKNRFPSWASEEYRQASANNLRHFIEHVRKQWYADRVIGYHIASGMWEEWFYWASSGHSGGINDFEDYSEPMVQEFQKWLRNKYGSDNSLQKAWNNNTVTLSTAQIPTKAERQATDLFIWRDPAIRHNVIDFYSFYCENDIEFIKLMARSVKKATNGEQLVGVFYGYMLGSSHSDNWQQNTGHLAFHKLLQCPDIDFFTAPSSYAFRELGTGYSTVQAPTDAVRLHGKYWMDENDYRTPLSSRQADSASTSDIEEFEAVQLRELGNIVTHAWGSWWFDMGGGWYDEPRFMDILKKLNEIGEKSIHFDRSANSEIAVVVDENSIYYTGLAITIMKPIMRDQILYLGKIGAPFDWVFLDDIDIARPYKFYIFLDAFHVDQQQKKAIDRLESRGAKGFLWLYGAGFAGEKSLDVKGCTDITGIKIKMKEKAGPLFIKINEKGADALPDVKTGLIYGSENKIGPLLYPEDSEADVLGIIEGNNVPGLVLKRINGVSVYYSSAPTIPSEVLRGMASKAGVHIYNYRNDALYANKTFLSISTGNSGIRNVRLPRRTNVYDVYNDTIIARNANKFNIDLPERHTILYFLGSEEEWKKIR